MSARVMKKSLFPFFKLGIWGTLLKKLAQGHIDYIWQNWESKLGMPNYGGLLFKRNNEHGIVSK